MADNKTNQERSRNMAAVKSRNTKPEMRLRRAIWRRGLRFFTPTGWKKLTRKSLPGSPDLIFPGPRIAVFLDGCFWHGCPMHYIEPADNREFWQRKLTQNKERDKEAKLQLTEQGWLVLRFWEHELRRGGLDSVAERVVNAVRTRGCRTPGEGPGHEGELSGLYGSVDSHRSSRE